MKFWGKFITLLFLLIVLGLGFYLRIAHINDKSLWLDEGITYYNSSGTNLSEVFTKVAHLDQSPPGFYIFTHYYLEFFGNNEFGLRMIPLIFGVLTILFTFLLGKELFGKTTGLVAAFLLAINAFHIGFSIEARMYALVALEAVAALYFLLKAVRSEGLKKFLYWVLFTLFAIAGLYSHNFFAFVAVALVISFAFILFSEKNKLINLGLAFLSGILIVSAYIPWLPSALKQFQVERYWIAPNHISDIWNYLFEFMNRDFNLFWSAVAVGIFAIFGTLLYFWNKNYKRETIGLLVLIIFLVLGMGLPLYYSLNVEPILKIRYMVFLVPIIMIIIARGVTLLGKINKVFSVILALLFCLSAFYYSQPWSASAYPMEMNEDFREIYQRISRNPAPVVVHTPSIAHVMNFYNEDNLNITPFPNSFDLSDYNIDLTYKRLFLRTIQNFDDFYLIVSHSHENPYGLLKVWSDGKCENQRTVRSDSMLIEAIYFSDCLLDEGVDG